MRERPIIMSAESVRAILDGRKTQTRRVVTPSRYMLHYTKEKHGGFNSLAQANDAAANAARSHLAMGHKDRLPYGQPGDTLWVREKFCAGVPATQSGLGIIPRNAPCAADRGPWKVVYAATSDYGNDQPPWRPSTHMPRDFSRITLEITGVRVERVQAISKDDCVAEGLKIPCNEQYRPVLQLSGKYAACLYPPASGDWKAATLDDYFRAYYASLWDNLNAKRGLPWASNPWVWCISFQRLPEPAGAA